MGQPSGSIQNKSKYVLGVDFAHMGEDASVFVILEKPFDDDKVYLVYMEETRKQYITQSINRVCRLESHFNFDKIYLDYTGLGVGPVDVLKTKIAPHKIVPFKFTMQSKEDLYNNLKLLMERGMLKIPDNKKLFYELCDLRYEYAANAKNIKIHHSDNGHDDYPDALALAALYFKPQRRARFEIA